MTATVSNGVDAHFHAFAAGAGGAGARYRPGYDAPLAAWREVASACGIARGVLVQTSFMGTDNALLLRELRADPASLRGVAVVDPAGDVSEWRELAAAGVRGVRLNLVGGGHAPDAWVRGGSAWQALEALGWHVEIHSDTGRLPEVLDWLPAAVPLVVDHMGKPARVSASDPTVRGIAARARRAPVYVKLSGAYRNAGLDAAALVRLWLDQLGPDRLLWGSDWPCTNHEAQCRYPRLLDLVREHCDAPTQQRVLACNPARLYGFIDPQQPAPGA